MAKRPDVEQLKDEIVQDTQVPPMIEAIGERLGAAINARAVFGPAVKRERITVIPVARAAWGFGAGGGSNAGGEESGAGGGGGGVAAPMGYIEVTDSGASYHRIDDPVRRAAAAALSTAAAGAMLWARSRRR